MVLKVMYDNVYLYNKKFKNLDISVKLYIF